MFIGENNSISLLKTSLKTLLLIKEDIYLIRLKGSFKLTSTLISLFLETWLKASLILRKRLVVLSLLALLT